MKVELTDISPVKKTMSIEVESAEMDQETQSVLKNYARKAKIPGFRPGKAPLSVVQARFAKEVQEDVQERMMARHHHQATEEKGLRPIGDPVIDEVDWKEGQPLIFKTTFEILPTVELKDYKNIEAHQPSDELDPKEVEQELEKLREMRASLVTEEGRKAATGDVIIADVDQTPEGGETTRQERVMLEVGSQQALPEFNEKLVGVEADAELEFSIDFPKEFPVPEMAGKPVLFKIKAHEVKRREVPELDDEFAKDLGDFDDLAALTARIEEDLGARKKAGAETALRQSVLDKVLLDHPVVLPDVLVHQEVRQRMEEVVRRMMMQGVDPEKAEIDWADMRKHQEEPARKAVHARIILSEIAKAESISLTPKELDDRIAADAQQMGEDPAELKQKLVKHGHMEALKNQLVREKSLDLLVSVANIQKGEK
jgi:trigger factor